MRPILLKGHERSITCLKYNRDGDLIFTTSKHPSFAVWWADNGERLGTFQGHTGAVWVIDVSRDSRTVITGAADTSARVWETETGKEIFVYPHKAPVRAIAFSHGEQQILTVTDQVLGFLPAINIWDFQARSNKPVIEIIGKNEAKIIQAVWSPLNKEIITANEDGTVRVYDVRNGSQTKIINDHTKAVMQVSFSKNDLLFATASKDGTAKLYDASTYKHLKTYSTGRPINSVSISPIKEELIVGGGQAAETVTTSRVDNAQFRVRFFHLVFEEELASIQGHFGPVNILSYSPDGRSFASGGEDGYVRLHHFDASYFAELASDS